ncbi:hypothetical protein [Mycobacterium kansasii]|uniref:hypothetical protein n=1 Tax=Mycobacterium kansasii TaxID=1768 RepID=UPI001FE24953|nr:hypothetical protein [Mycobacterium kansasii]
MRSGYAIVAPAVGRETLQHLIIALTHGAGPAPAEVVVDDRPGPAAALEVGRGLPLRVLAVRCALRRLRKRGLLLAVVTNQSGVARGLISSDQLAADADAVLMPTARTLPDEIDRAQARARVAATLDEAASVVLRGCR